VQINSFRMFYAQQCASRHWFLRSAEPDIHLLSRALMGRHRRLSLCSLPVPKQFEESLGRLISFAQSAIGGTWQSAHFVHPVSFGSNLRCRSPALFRRHEVSLLPIHGKQIRYQMIAVLCPGRIVDEGSVRMGFARSRGNIAAACD